MEQKKDLLECAQNKKETIDFETEDSFVINSLEEQETFFHFTEDISQLTLDDTNILDIMKSKEKIIFEGNVRSLHLEINSAILRNSRRTQVLPYGGISDNNKSDILIFEENIHDLMGEKIVAYEIKLQGKEFLVIEKYIALYTGRDILIFEWDDKLKVKKIKTLKTHILLFQIKTGTLNKETRMIFYKILLTLIKQKLKRLDSFLEGIIFYLDIDKLLKMKLYNEHLICYYKNGSKVMYNNHLKNVEGIFNYEEEAINLKDEVLEIIKYEKIEIIVKKNKVEIYHNDKSFYESIETKNVIQCSYTGNKLFLLTEEYIQVLEFNK